MSLSLRSDAFLHKNPIPSRFTCEGKNINPPLTITGVPDNTKSLVLLMDDPDIPATVKTRMGIDTFDHWVLYNLPADTSVIEEGCEMGEVGLNSQGEVGYIGPCPPTEYQPTTHRYQFRLYALDRSLSFATTPTLAEVETTAQSHALARTELTGTFSRVKE